MLNQIEQARYKTFTQMQEGNAISLEVVKIKYKKILLQIEFLRRDNLENFKVLQILNNRKFLLINLTNSNFLTTKSLVNLIKASLQKDK